MSKKSKFILVFATAILTFGSIMHFTGHQKCGSEKQSCHASHCNHHEDGIKTQP